jgi:hypothetical protein
MSKLSSIESYISPFAQKLTVLDTEALDITGYPKEYLQLLIHNHLYYLNIYAHVLDRLLLNIKRKKRGGVS